MAWRRKSGDKFSLEQREAMVALVQKQGWSIEAAAKEAGCDQKTVRYNCLRLGTKSLQQSELPEPRPPKPAPNKAATQRADAERAYLLWALNGALHTVEGRSFVDRLLADMAQGRFEL